MTLRVIGVGFPRTGTASLKAALEQLGVGPCYHMSECIDRPSDWPQWVRASEGEAVDWDEIFADFVATTDAPGCHFHAALAAAYPNAQLILTVRDADRWFESTQATILSPGMIQRMQAAPPELNAMMRRLGWHVADATTHDHMTMTARMRAHNEAVTRAFSPTRLLVFELRHGWEPLCKFLGLPVPDAPFPHINSTQDFGKMIASMAGLDNNSGVKRALAQQLLKH